LSAGQRRRLPSHLGSPVPRCHSGRAAKRVGRVTARRPADHSGAGSGRPEPCRARGARGRVARATPTSGKTEDELLARADPASGPRDGEHSGRGARAVNAATAVTGPAANIAAIPAALLGNRFESALTLHRIGDLAAAEAGYRALIEAGFRHP